MKLSTLVVPTLVLFGAVNAEAQALTPKALDAALAAHPSGAAAESLAGRDPNVLRRARCAHEGGTGEDRRARGRLGDRCPGSATERSPACGSAADVGGFILPLTRVGETSLYTGVATLAHGTAMSWHYEVGDRRAGGGQLETYEAHPDSREQPGVPKGTLKQMTAWESKVFEGTTRDWWVYVPAQYKAENPGGRDGVPGRLRATRTSSRPSSTT